MYIAIIIIVGLIAISVAFVLKRRSSSLTGDADVVNEIRRLRKNDPDVINPATLRLVEMGERAVGPLIQAMLSQKEAPNVRARAASAVGRIKSPQVFDSLIAALNDSEALVRWTVIKVLEDIGDVRALPALERLALTDDGEFDAARNWTLTVKSAAEEAIQKLTNKRAEE